MTNSEEGQQTPAPVINQGFTDGAYSKYISFPVLKRVEAGYSNLAEEYLGVQYPWKKVEEINAKVITQNGEPISRFLSKSYVLLPNEKLGEIIDATGFKVRSESRGRNGHAVVYTLEPVEWKEKQIAGVGEVFGVGAQIRNSEDGSIVFGADAYTLRKVCMNGATARTKELSYSLRHRGNVKDFTRYVVTVINSIFRNTEKLFAFYDKAAQINMNQEIAEAIARLNIPKQYHPKGFSGHVQRDPNTRKLKIDVNFEPSQTVWQVFNGFTEALTHNASISRRGGMSILSQTNHTANLHKVMVAAVNQFGVGQ